MAYAAVIYLKKAIERLCSTSSCVSILFLPFEIKFAHEVVCIFKDEIERLDRFSASREAFDDLASQIREAAWNLEDVLDLHGLGLSGDEEVMREARSFCKKANELVTKCRKLEVFTEYSHIDASSESGETIGTISLLDKFCVVGMAGIGKTTFALKVLGESIATGDYKVHAFVTIGQKPELRDVLLTILSQVGCGDAEINSEKVEELGSRLYCKLSNNSFIILLDDVWDPWFWKEFSRFLPQNVFGNIVLLTTRRKVVAKSISENVLELSFLSFEESWELFYAHAFQEDESCSCELMKAGKKIVDYCDGLPLALITVAKVLAKSEKTVEYWLKVANEETSVFEEAFEKMSQVMLPSYLYLPAYLKFCFLYLGVFPCKRKILYYDVMRLLEAEEFLEVPSPGWNSQNFVRLCLDTLASENVIIEDDVGDFWLHFSYWYLCTKEAERSKFYKVVKRRTDAFAEGIERERRLCIHNNVLLGIKDTRDLLSRVPRARSILCTGPYLQYPMSSSIDFDAKLLKVLKAENIRFCDFPVQLVKLVRLTYLALTCDRKLPASISKLCNLQYLIVKEHLRIRHSHFPTYLPMEIWDMKALKHLDVEGADLPEPDEDDALLENLTSLFGVSGHTCTKRVLERIPNVRHLSIDMELCPKKTLKLIGGFDNFHYLHELSLLIFRVMNPDMSTREIVHWPITASSFPSSLVTIKLSGQGYPWTMLAYIAKLPCLKVLELHNYACRGSQWTVLKDEGFMKLESLRIEDTDLEHWEVEEGAFPILENLTIVHCYKLKQLPKQLVYNSATNITLLDCNPLIDQMDNRILVARSFEY